MSIQSIFIWVQDSYHYVILVSKEDKNDGDDSELYNEWITIIEGRNAMATRITTEYSSIFMRIGSS
jgi:hypothetical protein